MKRLSILICKTAEIWHLETSYSASSQLYSRITFTVCPFCFRDRSLSLKIKKKGVLFLPPSDAYVRSFLYLLYTLIKLYYTKALSDQASSLAPDWILLLQGPRIPVSSCDSTTTFHLGGSSTILQDKMGANNSSLNPLNCILKNWDRFDPQGLKKTHLVFLCDTAWPRYPLEDSEWWPVGGSLKYNTVLQLDWFCKEQGKWVEVAYVLPFFSLWNMPDLCPKGINLGVKPSKKKKKLRKKTKLMTKKHHGKGRLIIYII